jgi:hypothetical protein
MNAQQNSKKNVALYALSLNYHYFTFSFAPRNIVEGLRSYVFFPVILFFVATHVDVVFRSGEMMSASYARGANIALETSVTQRSVQSLPTASLTLIPLTWRIG